MEDKERVDFINPIYNLIVEVKVWSVFYLKELIGF